jgi:hypothetical protein
MSMIAKKNQPLVFFLKTLLGPSAAPHEAAFLTSAAKNVPFCNSKRVA